ncbi:formylglycine-generating enzyme family protein [uncultured Nostoc sp.]|uniref:formylglycine-generating enzyme family protein n=1 Tax=uncultured Nostoc sp. TaxID=340711 RepID=UPI0035CB5C1B
MTDLANTEQLREQAKQAVDRFVRRFDESYRLLAYHAALPLVLTPELVNYLRNEFLRGEQVPWVAEVDLLLSDLCSQVGYELYAMETHVREYLLEQMQQHPDLGKRRMQEVAQFLYSYVSYLSRLNPGRRQQEIEAQRWAAMVYLGDEQCKKAVREIAQRLIETSSGAGEASRTESGIRAELARLTRITDELSPQLEQEPTLLDYARLVQRVLRTPEQVSVAELRNSYQVEDLELKFPDRLLPEDLARTLTSSRQIFPNLVGFPPIQIFEFKVKTIAIVDDIDKLNLKPFQFEVALIAVNQPAQIDTSSLVEMVDEIIFTKTEKRLNDVEQLVIQGVLANQTYEQIAASADKSVEYLPVTTRTNLWKYLRNNVAPNLWKLLSTVFGEKVTKRNVKKVIEEWAAHRDLTINRHPQEAQYFIEELGNGIQLEMVSISEGSLMMGAAKTEEESSDDERPQHQVTVSTFLIGKYPVTQEQWGAVAALPQINREFDSDPSRFKGANRPVEKVCWYDAVEFCDRLSQHTKRQYRLPSEAEWEYACRAGTTTPFHFGETMTSELANYDASKVYGAGVKGTYREETTPVGSFNAANTFGLYDMHGNVWEWCLDDWHGSYEGAPTDGSAWFDNDANDDLYQKQGNAVLRGGSWINYPVDCRSAYRSNFTRDSHGGNFGFRVVCAAGRILW